jgi:hypothetical protein
MFGMVRKSTTAIALPVENVLVVSLGTECGFPQVHYMQNSPGQPLG